MRVFVAATFDGLRRLHAEGHLPAGSIGYAATDRLGGELAGLGDEDTEFALSTAAAEASLDMIADSGADRGRRVVVVAEVPDRLVDEDGEVPGVVRVAGLELSVVEAIMVDTADVDVSDGGNDAALSWFATQELGYLLA